MSASLLDEILNASTTQRVEPTPAPAPVAVATPKTVPTVDKAFLLNLLNSSDPNIRMHTVGRALKVLFERQTFGEKVANRTSQNNGRGFTGADAYSGSITAKSYIKNGSLKDWQVNRWTKGNRLLKYWRQLDEAAKEKAASKAYFELKGGK